MSTSVVNVAPLVHAHAEVDELLGAPLELWSSDTLMDAWREVERLRNRLVAVEHRFVAAAEARQLPAEFGAKNTAAFLRGLLRVDSYDASARVRAVDAAVGRATLTGEPTPAPFAQVSEFTVHQRADGSSTVSGEATAELTERLLTLFDALAAPKLAADGMQDARTAAQRRHDALNDALDLVQRAELLPDTNGVTTTVILTATRHGWEMGQGVATTGHGAVPPVKEAIRIAGGDARIMTVPSTASVRSPTGPTPDASTPRSSAWR